MGVGVGLGVGVRSQPAELCTLCLHGEVRHHNARAGVTAAFAALRGTARLRLDLHQPVAPDRRAGLQPLRHSQQAISRSQARDLCRERAR